MRRAEILISPTEQSGESSSSTAPYESGPRSYSVRTGTSYTITELPSKGSESGCIINGKTEDVGSRANELNPSVQFLSCV